VAFDGLESWSFDAGFARVGRIDRSSLGSTSI
jgi:hypothetical protein